MDGVDGPRASGRGVGRVFREENAAPPPGTGFDHGWRGRGEAVPPSHGRRRGGGQGRATGSAQVRRESQSSGNRATILSIVLNPRHFGYGERCRPTCSRAEPPVGSTIVRGPFGTALGGTPRAGSVPGGRATPFHPSAAG